MQKIFLFIFLIAFAQTVWTQPTRKPDTKEEQRISHELGKDQEYITVRCRIGHAVTNTERDTSYRLKALEAFNRGDEKSKLKKSCGTKEGTSIYSYLMVERGKASVVIDTYHDKFGPQRLYSYQCSELEIGVYFNDLKLRKMIFEKNETDKTKDGYVALRCVAGDNEIIF